MKKTIILFTIMIILAISAQPVIAVSGGQIDRRLDKIGSKVADLKEKIATSPAWLHVWKNNKIAFENGALTAINGGTLTITKDTKTYTVVTDNNTKFKRKFWGDSSLSELSVGDKLNVVGAWDNSAKTTIRAKMVRDVSIQMLNGVFFGNVTAKSDTGFTIETINRGSQSVTITSSTQYINRKDEGIGLADIAVGHKLRVRGLWNSTKNTITEVTKVKDFSLPLKVTASPSSSPANQ